MIKIPEICKRQGILSFVASPLLVTAFLLVVATFPGKTLAASPGWLDATPTTTQPAFLPAGDLERGRQLFMGNVHFQNGGPPCMGCHNIGSDGLLGGGTLGPDLTDVSSRYVGADLAQALNGIPWKTMSPIFAEHPITPQEQADLLVFLQASAGQPKTDREPLLFGFSLTGLMVAAGLFGFLYRARLRGVRKPLVKGARSDGQGK
jgi:mono/diheme cytochrome c family protein